MTARRQQGFTLIELMVALVIGLLLLAGVLQILLSNKTSFEAQRATAHLQENARLAEFVLSHAIAHAGYRASRNTAKPTLFPKTSDTAPNYPDTAYITGLTSPNGRSDILRLRFQARGDVRDCLGGTVGSAQTPQKTDFEFFVNSRGALECRKFKSSSTTTEPIVENVDRFQVRYGLDTDDDLAVDRYVASLSNHEATEVRSVRFQLLLKSADDDPALSKAIKQRYIFADGASFEVTDRHARILVDRTVAIRNPPPPQ